VDSHDLFAVLDQFFHRRARYDSVKWHTENVAAGGSFIVPPGKIYEVKVAVPANRYVLLDGINLSVNAGAFSHWFPAFAADTAYFDSVAAIEFRYTSYYAFPQGWILSENSAISLDVATAFKVLWRDITHLQ